MIISTAEFNVNSGNILRGAVRPVVTPAAQGTGRAYKAIVVIFLAGGADRYSSLALSFSRCIGTAG